MELSFVYDSAHFAPFAQPSEDATRTLSRVTIEPSVAGFAQEATTALNAAEEKLKRGETMEAVKLYLAASRAYLKAAEGVNNEQTALMLIFLSHSITRKIEGLRAQIASGSSSSLASGLGVATTASSASTPSETPPLTEQQAGRLSFEGVRSKLRNIDKVPEAISQPSPVEDILALERRLAELGLVQGRAPMESVSAVQGYSSGTLGESFYVLGRNASHIAEFTPLDSDDFNASKGLASSRKFDMKPPVMRRTTSTEAKAKGMGAASGTVDPLSLSVYPTKALGDVPDATLAASVNFSVGPNVGYANNENISRLLHAMDRLSKENEALLKEREAGMRYMEENKQLRRQTQEFKKLYDEKFAKLKKVLHDFAAHYPTETNPANDVHKSEREKLQRRVVELEKVVSTLLKRVDNQKKQIEADRANMAKKDDLIQRYERVFKEIKDRQRQRRPDDSSASRSTQPSSMSSEATASAPAPPPSPAPHHRLQQPQDMRMAADAGLSPSAASQKVLAYNPPRATQRTAPRPSTSTMASLSSSGIAGQSGKAKMQPSRHRS